MKYAIIYWCLKLDEVLNYMRGLTACLSQEVLNNTKPKRLFNIKPRNYLIILSQGGYYMKDYKKMQQQFAEENNIPESTVFKLLQFYQDQHGTPMEATTFIKPREQKSMCRPSKFTSYTNIRNLTGNINTVPYQLFYELHDNRGVSNNITYLNLEGKDKTNLNRNLRTWMSKDVIRSIPNDKVKSLIEKQCAYIGVKLGIDWVKECKYYMFNPTEIFPYNRENRNSLYDFWYSIYHNVLTKTNTKASPKSKLYVKYMPQFFELCKEAFKADPSLGYVLDHFPLIVNTVAALADDKLKGIDKELDTYVQLVIDKVKTN